MTRRVQNGLHNTFKYVLKMQYSSSQYIELCTQHMYILLHKKDSVESPQILWTYYRFSTDKSRDTNILLYQRLMIGNLTNFFLTSLSEVIKKKKITNLS